MRDGRIFLKKPAATFPLRKAYRMSLLSAWSISLDSTFKVATNQSFPILRMLDFGHVQQFAFYLSFIPCRGSEDWIVDTLGLGCCNT